MADHPMAELPRHSFCANKVPDYFILIYLKDVFLSIVHTTEHNAMSK
jgi:hypothetical protein